MTTSREFTDDPRDGIMALSAWHKRLNRIFRIHRQSPNSAPSFQPTLEALEERSLPSITPTAQTLSFVEGGSSTPLVATFTDSTPSAAANYAVNIDWGDGSAHSTGTVTFDAASSTFS